jgi:hypothetical protein
MFEVNQRNSVSLGKKCSICRNDEQTDKSVAFCEMQHLLTGVNEQSGKSSLLVTKLPIVKWLLFVAEMPLKTLVALVVSVDLKLMSTPFGGLRVRCPTYSA